MARKCMQWMMITLLMNAICVMLTVYIVVNVKSQNIVMQNAAEMRNLEYWNNRKVDYFDYKQRNHVKNYKILFWNPSVWKWFGSGSALFAQCAFSNCLTIKDKSEYESADAVIMYMYKQGGLVDPIPKHRHPSQKWILRLRESPAYTRVDSALNGLFNATWSYKNTSDIFALSLKSRVVQINGPPPEKYVGKNFADGKVKMVAWFVSDCESESIREQYVASLQKHIQVDIYGQCGALKCGDRITRNENECLRILEKDYKFYLAFENSVCDGFVTEKLWRALEADIIPIVLGGADYKSFLPPNSFIDVTDFKSARELALYLHKLNESDDLYNSYFTWKLRYQIVGSSDLLVPPDQRQACVICKYLNEKAEEVKVYDRLDLFWNKYIDCQQPLQYYRSVDQDTLLSMAVKQRADRMKRIAANIVPGSEIRKNKMHSSGIMNRKNIVPGFDINNRNNNASVSNVVNGIDMVEGKYIAPKLANHPNRNWRQHKHMKFSNDNNIGQHDTDDAFQPMRTRDDRYSFPSDLLRQNHSTYFKLLYWTPMSKYSWGWDWVGYGFEPFSKCKYSNCMTTANRSEYSSSDVVIMYMHQPQRLIDLLPTYRIPGQKWLIRLQETVTNHPIGMTYNRLFNATWSYKVSSDIFTQTNITHFVKRQQPGSNPSNSNLPAAGKTKMVAWFVSHCKSRNYREDYVKVLQKHIKVDIYGKCGPLKCGSQLNKTAADCMEMLEKDYRFYLAFENSFCKEYVTEKLWRTINMSIIPVVLGGANYSDYIPPHSYIDVRDFKGPLALASYLHEVANDEALYNSYFAWKRDYKWVVDAEKTEECVICRYVNENYNKVQIYDRLDLFWNENRDCIGPETYYKKLKVFPGYSVHKKIRAAIMS